MADIIEAQRDDISCTYYFNDHIYIGKTDGSLIQMNMNGEIISHINNRGYGVITTIFCSENKLVTCGGHTLGWEMSCPLKRYTVGFISYAYSASFGDMVAFSSKCGPILMGPIEYISPDSRSTIAFGSSVSCLYMDGPVVFAGFVNGEFLKVDYLTGKLIYIYEVEHGNITLNDGEEKLYIKPGEVISICTWRDSIVVLSDHIDSGIYPGNMATVIRWNCVSTGSYKPDLFFKMFNSPIKIMDDQLFELGNLTINCWSWDKILLRSFVHSSSVNGSIPDNALFVNGCIYLVDNDMKIWKRTGILIEFTV